MSNDKLVRFSIDQELTPEQIEDMQFSKVKMKIYSAEKINAYGYYITLKNMKKWAKTISGKPIVMYYNKVVDDFGGHEKEEIACGFIPTNPKITYETSEDGTVYLCVVGYIWNMYYDYVVNVFKADGEKGVSCEMLVVESEYDADLDAEEILQYSFAGITLLGNYDKNFVPIKPAVEGCNAILVENSMSIEDFNKAKNEFEQILNNSVNEESFVGDSFFNKENLKENNMEEKDLLMNSETPTSIEDATLVENSEVIEEAEVVENALKEVTSRVQVETETWNYDDDGCYVGRSSELHRMTETHFEEVNEDGQQIDNATEDNSDEVIENAETNEEKISEEEVVENTCKKEEDSVVVENAITQEQYDELLQKNSDLENDLEELKVAYNALLVKCSALQEFKDNTEQKAMKNSIEVALNSVSHILNAEQVSEWRTKSEECTVDTLSDFTNRLKAFAFDVQEKNGVQNVETIRNSIPVEVEEFDSTDVWERLNKKYIV